MELKKCPFCGEAMAERYSPPYRYTGFGYHYHTCPTIGCPSSRLEIISNNEDRWNKRADDWQPIKTAPTDGTVVLGYDPSWYDIATPMLYNDGWVFFHIQTETIRPTHWMPIPDLPK